MTLELRELRAGDRRAIAFMFSRLGPDSRYQRFLRARKALDARELDQLAAVDHWHHEALIAWAGAAPVGIARYVRTPDFEVAELAVTVVDAWQRHGVGSLLVDALRERAGVRRFSATILRSNRGALALTRPYELIEANGDVVEVIFSTVDARARLDR